MASSEIALTEVVRAIGRMGGPVDRAEAVVRSLALVPLDRTILSEAASLRPWSLRSLDAVHLASALSLRPDVSVFLAYDARLSRAASAAGLVVHAPGAAGSRPADPYACPMTTIDVTSADDAGIRFAVEIRDEDGSRTGHEVTVSDADWARFGAGFASRAALVDASFRFLLEREPKGAATSPCSKTPRDRAVLPGVRLDDPCGELTRWSIGVCDASTPSRGRSSPRSSRSSCCGSATGLTLRDRRLTLSSSALVGVIAAPVWSSVADRASRHGPDAAARVRVGGRPGDRAGAHRLGVPGSGGRRRGARDGAGAADTAHGRARDAHARTGAHGTAPSGCGRASGGASVRSRSVRCSRPPVWVDAAGLRGRRDRCRRVRRALPSRAPAGTRRRDVAVRCGGRGALDGAGLRAVPARRLRVRRVDARVVGLRPAADPGGRRGSVPGRGSPRA